MGGNGVGKTSLLEAIFVLGRARSFRVADSRLLVQSGASSAYVSGCVVGPLTDTRLALRVGLTGTEIRINGRPDATVADLASALPVQALHTEIGAVVQGPPDGRRRLLDWGVFHVKPTYLGAWRQYRRALMQRNAALRDRGGEEPLAAWEVELAAAAGAVDRHRADYVAELLPEFRAIGRSIIGADVDLRYQRGWGENEDLTALMRSWREGDRAAGYTRVGPQRADLVFELAEEKSRWTASKGQQKLLGAAFVLAQSSVVARTLGRSVVLLVDEPAADLDPEHLVRFLAAIERCPAQVFVAAINGADLPLGEPAAMFHVEHGEPKPLL